MTGWNYRIVKIRRKYKGKNYDTYSLQEVYYGEDDFPNGTTTEDAGIGFFSDTKTGFYDEIGRVLLAVTKPILYFDIELNKFVQSKEEKLDKQKIRAILKSILDKLKGEKYNVLR